MIDSRQAVSLQMYSAFGKAIKLSAPASLKRQVKHLRKAKYRFQQPA